MVVVAVHGPSIDSYVYIRPLSFLSYTDDDDDGDIYACFHLPSPPVVCVYVCASDDDLLCADKCRSGPGRVQGCV